MSFYSKVLQQDTTTQTVHNSTARRSNAAGGLLNKNSNEAYTNNDRRPNNQSGFTLIEILIAVVIFALMAAVAYRGLDAILESKRQIDIESEKWRKITLFLTRLERDFSVIAPRSIKDAIKGDANALVGEVTATGDYDAQLAFTRMGSSEELNTLAAPQRVGYRLRSNHIEILRWPVLDQAPNTKPAVSILMPDISALEFRYLDENAQWVTRWAPPIPPGAKTSDQLPNAVEVKLTLKTGEIITRLFDLP